MFVNKPDIIILTETWLEEGVNNQELNLNNYFVYRCDRKKSKGSNTNTIMGGGVLVAVAKTLKSSIVKFDVDSLEPVKTVGNQNAIININEIYVKVKIGNLYYRCSVYTTLRYN